MFNLESYITPVILSYVEKYVKNFKPEQSQVSLWGGDASFQNLDLRLEVLEEQLNLPFSFVSGHIHELLIHVPWVKITSEPIVVTINTIECILKLKDENQAESRVRKPQKRRTEQTEEEAPPGYIKSMVTKVVNNITINCNNLILKYVEEDIVLSVNIRFLGMQTVNNKWEPAFTDVSSYEVLLRKVITIQDLTLCLDKMDASGKIEVYQDPVLYRCSMIIRLIVNYHSNTAKHASITRLDLHCEKMEFSMTEQQIPMLLRLIALVIALQTKMLPSSRERSLISTEDSIENEHDDDSESDTGSQQEGGSWAGWAWNMVPSLLPVHWDNDWCSEQLMAYTGHTIHMGFYVDDATVTFKTMDSVKEQLFYKPRKTRYKSFLSLKLNGVVIDVLQQGMTWTSLQAGLGSVHLFPRGSCSCGHLEVIDGAQPPLYISAGKLGNNHLKDSLFDEDAVENKGKKRVYKHGIDYHLATVSVKGLLERCPAFVMDYIYLIDLPEDITPEKLSEFNSNFEYSNFHEHRVVRYVVGELTVRMCSGLFHRIESIKQAAMKYDYTPYIVLKPDPTLDELPPVTVEEYDALRENISKVEIKLILIKGTVELQLADHQITGLPRKRKLIEKKTAPLTPALSDDPVLSIELDKLQVDIDQPMYPHRLVACACKQTELPSDMLNSCHRLINAAAYGVKCQLNLTRSSRTTVVMPFNIRYTMKMLLYPQYWLSFDMAHVSHYFQVDGITITGTKVKLMVATSIVTSIVNPDSTMNPLICSSLFNDACQEKDPVYLEICLEGINGKSLSSLATVSNILNISSAKIFLLNDFQQAFVVSGPESDHPSEAESKPLLTAVVQYSKDPNKQVHPPILSFEISEIRGSLDPLLSQWLQYCPVYHKLDQATVPQPEIQHHNPGEISPDTSAHKKNFPSLSQSVHSSSDKDKRKSAMTLDESNPLSKPDDLPKSEQKTEALSTQTKLQKMGILDRMVDWYAGWCGLVLSGCIGHIVVYIPTTTMSGIGVHGIEQAKDQALKEDQNLQLLVIKTPSLYFNSTNIQAESLSTYHKELPVQLPNTMWTPKTQSFPWTINVNDFHCYTLQKERQHNFIKKVSLNATVGLTAKASTESSTLSQVPLRNKLTALSLCVHVDTTPITISISEEQVLFMSSIAANVFASMPSSYPQRAGKSVSDEPRDTPTVLPTLAQSSPNQTLFREGSTTTSTLSTAKDDIEQEKDSLTLTAWVQWTINKLAVKLYLMGQPNNPSLKLALDLEDIITSLDLQPVYLKLKTKITTATIFNYIRAPKAQIWDLGEYGGLVMCGREDNLEKGEDSGFLSLTLTRAKCGNVHTRWGTQKRHKIQRIDVKSDSSQFTSGYISEVVIKIQLLDIVLPLSIIGKYTQLVEPFVRLTHSSKNKGIDNTQEKFTPSTLSNLTNLRNDSLPLVYLEFKGCRLMLPASTTARYALLHDLLMIQLDGISITPHAENPICRIPIRSDIYQLAAQANILSIPGSAVEDRQYQINVKGVCADTTTWKNYQLSVTKRTSQSYLYTMNENPALEWNKLSSGISLEPNLSTFPMITRFDLCLIIAPATVFKPDTIVCGNAVEINCLTDIDVTINLNQIRLISTLCNELETFVSGNTKENDNSLFPIKLQTTKQPSCAPISEEADIDFAKDSGVDFEMSSMNSTIIGKPTYHGTTLLPPFEFLVNCGKIIFILYETKKSSTDSEYQMDTNEVEDDNGDVKQPLFYLMIDQPNIYISQQNLTQKLQVTCFDIAAALGDEQETHLTSVPNQSDFTVCLMETKNGDPHTDTGIPPSFITIKCHWHPTKNPHYSVNMGRPTKVHCSLSRLNFLESMKNKLISYYYHDNIIINLPPDSSREPNIFLQQSSTRTSHNKYNIPDLNVSTKQILLSFKTDSGSEISVSLAALTGNTSTAIRPERIYENLSLDSLIISVVLDGNMKVLLNPWCCNITVYLLWESWQDVDTLPQMQVQADSESLYLDVGPEHLKIISTVIQDCQMIANSFIPFSKEQQEETVLKSITSVLEQHYKDDLKAGAFQFIDGNGDEFPFPYQVVFLTCPQQAMAWRYPQPRALTKLHVSPVPFKTSVVEVACDEQVPCSVEYWSDSHAAYQHYADFYLSETDSYRLDFPNKTPARAVACIWRVVLTQTHSQTHSKSLVSARALAACLRIDSYFNPTIVPNLQAALNIGTIHVAFHNNVDSASYNTLPSPLQNYALDSPIPETQCFLICEHKKAIIVLNRWVDGALMVDIGGIVGIRVLDYGLLNMHEVLDPLEGKVQLSIADTVDLSVICNPFSLKFSPAISHTLAVSAHLWAIAFNNDNKNVVILTRYVIGNDSNIPIRIGQSSTDDNIILQSRQCHFYSWRNVNNQMLRIAVEETGWNWSQPFAVNNNGIQLIDFGTNASRNVTIFVNVTSLSATQKLITFSGQLVISNQLVDNFEMKLVKYDVATETTTIPSKEIHIIRGRSQPSSIVLGNGKHMAMRLRFSSLSNLSWTGDIPLQPNTKCSQPWLVKVPLQERGQFLSIWVRIVVQNIHNRTKILAVLSPLYMIRSYLPVPAKVQMETPSLKVSLSASVNGRGERQQLYCPGTFEHFHQLTFQLESGISASNPYVPLSYSSVDQRKFFKRPENEDIDAILKELESLKDEPQWPFQGDDLPEWTAAEQPQTHVQVKYQEAGLVSSTLLLELQPWCFILNSLGCHLSLVSEDIELCQVPHYGIVTPPKLDGTFHLGVGLGDTYFTSPALQLARPDWSQSFYMPRIGGLIPLEGNMKTAVDCGASICVVSVNSNMHEDMRLVRVSSSHVIANLTPQELSIATLTVSETSSNVHLPADLTPYSANILPSEDQKYATPIVQWYLLHEQENVDPMALYISLSLGYRWSCPIRVDQGMSRRCLAIPNGSTTLPIVVTTQEDKGTTYITIHVDKYPQLSINNGCNFNILLGQANADMTGILSETPQFSWICDVESGSSCHYSLPAVGSRLPDSPALSSTPLLLLAAASNDVEAQSLNWSRGVSLSAMTSVPSDQYVRLPLHGDIKLMMYTRCYTTYINILPISQVEISARDIRSRLFHNENKSNEVEMIYNRKLTNILDESTTPLIAQSSPSSTSVTSFFSAQEDISGTNSPVSSQHNLKQSNTKLRRNMRAGQLNDRCKRTTEFKDVWHKERSITIYFRGITLIITQDVNENAQTIEVASLTINDLFFTMEPKQNILSTRICIGDFQLDNQIYGQGGFDFPVVLIGQNPVLEKELTFSLNSRLSNVLTRLQKNSLLAINIIFENDEESSGVKEVRVTLAPVSAYIEDTYITQLLDYATSLVPPCFVMPPDSVKKLRAALTLSTVYVPDYIMMDAKILSSPLRLQNLIIDPVSILLSVHTSVRLYLALDHSPLYFGTFERKNLLTTPYRLGNALTMHYLSGAIFGAGWVVGSLEILGSPGGLAQALGCGLRDFVSLPFQGLLHGPWGFLVGVTHGSASLMKHVTAGTVNSVTKLASSVARNLDRLTLDVEHLQRQEESRRIRPQGMAQGLYQGLTGFGMSLLAAVAGLAHHPLQQVWSGGATTRGLVTGVGLGLVGVVTKPLSGAAELVALTGQGLLQGAGWNPLPSPRQRPVVQYSSGGNNAPIRYAWRLMPLLISGRDSILHIINADHVIHQGSNQAVSLVLTRQVLLVVNIAEDSTEKVFTLNELTNVDHPGDSTMLCLHCPPAVTQPAVPSSPREYREMDQGMRARVEEFVRTSSTGLASLPTDSDAQSDSSEHIMPPADNTVTFYVAPDSRNYFLSLLNVAKRQSQGKGYKVL